MSLQEFLGTTDPNVLDPDRPLEIAGFSLGAEATAEAIRIMGGAITPLESEVWLQESSKAEFFQTNEKDEQIGYVISVPKDQRSGFPTAHEVCLVHTLHAYGPETIAPILDSGFFSRLGTGLLNIAFSKLLKRMNFMGQDKLSVLQRYRVINRIPDSADFLSEMDISCLAGYLSASPTKFKFVELYRLMEARYLQHVRSEFLKSFDTQPKDAAAAAVKSLDSEITQIALLADRHPDNFEIIHDLVSSMSKTNRLAAAICRKLDRQGSSMKSPKEHAGAALIYYLRCAIVHAGGKDLIYENFGDGDALLEVLMEYMEEASLALAGLSLSGK